MCAAKEKICNICKNKGHFGRLCKSKGIWPVVNNVEENKINLTGSYSPENPHVNTEENFCGVIDAWTDR